MFQLLNFCILGLQIYFLREGPYTKVPARSLIENVSPFFSSKFPLIIVVFLALAQMNPKNIPYSLEINEHSFSLAPQNPWAVTDLGEAPRGA